MDPYWGVLDTVAGVLEEYLTQARGEPGEALTVDTPFMDAGLDSLDMLKVSPRCSRRPTTGFTSTIDAAPCMTLGGVAAGGGPRGKRCEHGIAVDLRVRLPDRLCPDRLHSRVPGDSPPCST